MREKIVNFVVILLAFVLGAAGMYYFISQNSASTVCQNMYGSSGDITSDLINSYSWDTAIMFIEKCGTNSNYANYYNSYQNLTKTGYKVGSVCDKQCNVYDMGGNVSEWSTESYSQSNYADSMRGGDCTNTARKVRSRLNPHRSQYETIYYTNWLGFRPILYLN